MADEQPDFARVRSTSVVPDLCGQPKAIGRRVRQEFEQAHSAISTPLLCILTFWLAILFVSFGMWAPANSTVITALFMAALAVSGAIFLMTELNSPFSGVLQIPSAPFDDAIAHLGQ